MDFEILSNIIQTDKTSRIEIYGQSKMIRIKSIEIIFGRFFVMVQSFLAAYWIDKVGKYT